MQKLESFAESPVYGTGRAEKYRAIAIYPGDITLYSEDAILEEKQVRNKISVKSCGTEEELHSWAVSCQIDGTDAELMMLLSKEKCRRYRKNYRNLCGWRKDPSAAVKMMQYVLKKVWRDDSMIYLDNAATTLQNREAVYDAVYDAMKTLGNSGRGFSGAALEHRE